MTPRLWLNVSLLCLLGAIGREAVQDPPPWNPNRPDAVDAGSALFARFTVSALR